MIIEDTISKELFKTAISMGINEQHFTILMLKETNLLYEHQKENINYNWNDKLNSYILRYKNKDLSLEDLVLLSFINGIAVKRTFDIIGVK